MRRSPPLEPVAQLARKPSGDARARDVRTPDARAEPPAAPVAPGIRRRHRARELPAPKSRPINATPSRHSMSTPFDPRNFTPRADELAGRVIAITGPTRGIGHAVALACAQHGASVVLIGRNVKKLEEVHAEIAAARAGRGDDRAVRSGESGRVGLRHARRRPARSLRAARRAASQREPARDARAHRALRRADVVPGDARERDGRVRTHAGAAAGAEAIRRTHRCVFTSSSVGRKGRAYWGAYAVSKFAIEGLAQMLAAELENISRRFA